MRFSRHNATLLVALLSGALLSSNVGVAYLHLCFDGREPPVTLHLVGDTLHDDSDSQHSDQDVDPAKAALVKLLWQGMDMPAITIAFVLLPLLPLLSHALVRPGLLIRSSSASSYVRPRLRAPPL